MVKRPWARGVFLGVWTLCASVSAWAQTYSVLKTFEGLESPSSAPIRDAQGNLFELLAGGGTWGQGAIVRRAPDGTLTILHNFTGADGGRPAGDLLRDRHGNLYGAASFEGGGHAGTIFKLARDGTFTLLHTFNQNTDGGFPNGGLIRDRSGNLYGTTSTGGPNGEGTVFKLARNGTYTVLHSFALDTNGFLPTCCLVRDAAGNLYGTTARGGSGGGQFGDGTIFKLAPDGTHTILYNFTGGGDGAEPAGLLRVPSGDLVGIAQSGGSGGQGTIFKLSTSGTFTVLYSLSSYPRGGLTLDLNGNLYGVSPQGGSGNGSLFRLAPDGTFTILHSLAGVDEGFSPQARPVLDAAGNLYGTTLQGGPGANGTLFSLAPDGTLTLLHGFSGALPNGLALDASGNLFGTTQRGGVGNGSVFELAPVDGTYTVLHSFDPRPDGGNPFASLILDGSKSLYGTTFIGGPNGFGTAFKLAANGTYTVLHGFGGFAFPPDGRSPVARLVSDASGNLYGTAPEGGANFMGGIVFKLTPGGAYSVLHSFGGRPGEGLQPMAGLVIDASGTLYGTTLQGGVAGAGIVFKLAPDGTYTILHSFAGADGTNPLGALAQDSSGNLYGTTSSGGASSLGTVFKIAPDGTYTVLRNFALVDGASPKADVILDSSGNLYGTTSAGGGSNLGTVFKLAPDGTYSVLHSFSGDDGAFPTAGLVLSGSGVLFGTTSTGGPLAGGVVFQIAP